MIKSLLFLLSQVIASIGLWQTVQRTHTSFLIASYLRIFIEPRTTGLRWESRLKEFRKRIPATSFSLRFGEFFIYQLLTYLFLIAITFLSSAALAIYEFRDSFLVYVVSVLALGIGALTLWFLRTSWSTVKSYSANSGETFEPIWKQVREEEGTP
jgi:hypothetical protein